MALGLSSSPARSRCIFPVRGRITCGGNFLCCVNLSRCMTGLTSSSRMDSARWCDHETSGTSARHNDFEGLGFTKARLGRLACGRREDSARALTKRERMRGIERRKTRSARLVALLEKGHHVMEPSYLAFLDVETAKCILSSWLDTPIYAFVVALSFRGRRIAILTCIMRLSSFCSFVMAKQSLPPQQAA